MRAKTDKFVNNPDWNRLWPTGFHFDLNLRDSTANGVVTIQTFNENVRFRMNINAMKYTEALQGFDMHTICSSFC